MLDRDGDLERDGDRDRTGDLGLEFAGAPIAARQGD